LQYSTSSVDVRALIAAREVSGVGVCNKMTNKMSCCAKMG
jgi:hypothetical protein